MWCPTCKRRVAGRKNGHALRNTGGLLGAVPTLGLSLLATKSEQWHCPHCGGRAQYGGARKAAAATPRELPATGPVAVTLIDHGRSKIQTVKIYRRATRAGMREAMNAIEALPTVVGRFEQEKADALMREFQAAGCSVTAELLTDPGPEGEAAGRDGLAAELAQLSKLHSDGALSADEFAAAKARLLV
ncbi:MAG: Ribosomal protein C-terminal domain [Solirubrobacteraceae bacterium]|nr:Ribosomal protein C-terminal domain [Solirubrobacteraceae bacterium]